MGRRNLKPSINSQLGIGVPNNPNIPSRYARGLFTMQPQLGVEDWSLDYYNDIDSMRNSSNASGDYIETWSNGGGYGIFCGKKCQAEKKAQGIPPKRGKKNIAAFEAEQAAKAEQMAIQEAKQAKESKNSSSSNGGKLSTGAKIGIGVGSAVLLGLIIYLIARKR